MPQSCGLSASKVRFANVRSESRVPKTLCIANQKGGVGKTTTVINLADALARAGSRCLIVDLDPQCNATTGLGLRPLDQHPLVGETPLRNWIATTSNSRLDVLPGSRRFRDVDLLANAGGSEAKQLVDHMHRGTTAYDYVLIDCPPSLGQLTRTALAAANEVLMPIQCEYFAMEGLVHMIEVIRDVMNTHPNRLEFGGILLTMYDHDLELTQEVDREVREFFGEIVFDTVIPRDPRVCEAPGHGQSVLNYAPRSPGTRAYVELCLEVLDRD
jgi:chromosome partitioning protein